MTEPVVHDGCKKYNVEKSLLDSFSSTQLARLAACSSSFPPSFSIDIDEDRFQYILDYMRHGKVVLPFDSSAATKEETLLTEFGWYGFDNANNALSNAIQVALFS